MEKEEPEPEPLMACDRMCAPKEEGLKCGDGWWARNSGVSYHRCIGESEGLVLILDRNVGIAVQRRVGRMVSIRCAGKK